MNSAVSPAKYQTGDTLEGVNWNNIPDSMDLDIWNRLVSNFWVDTAIPLSNDKQSWSHMNSAEKSATMRVFTGLALLDSIQGSVGAIQMIPDAVTQHEEAVLCNQAFMEQIHSKSYSSIFMTLATATEIDEAFRWSRENEHLQYKSRRIMDFYRGDDPIRKKAASVMLESFLFYSGFLLPLKFSSRGKLTNTADIIRLIIRDEAIHGYYIGYKYQQAVRNLPRDEQDELQDEVIELLMDLYDNECRYTEDIYDDLGWTEDVKGFLRYNANKAMNNLGYEGIFPADDTKFDPAVRTSLDPSSNENHDFFSGSGSSYVIGTSEETEDEDWSW